MKKCSNVINLKRVKNKREKEAMNSPGANQCVDFTNELFNIILEDIRNFVAEKISKDKEITPISILKSLYELREPLKPVIRKVLSMKKS